MELSIQLIALFGQFGRPDRRPPAPDPGAQALVPAELLRPLANDPRWGEILDSQVKQLVSCWREGDDRTVGVVGPCPFTKTGPRLMFGGSSQATWRRLAEHGAGWMCGHGGPAHFRKCSEELERAWMEAGRPGRPRRLMAVYFALGDKGAEAVRTFIESYFGFAPFKEILLAATPKSRSDVAVVVEKFTAAGCDELVLFPCAGGLEQVELLAEAVSGR
jgi:alkanesulfonate monooxygenase SsuD/methylene tetrahydromethanopterin reductase-like flavin-dependent oxidoreductase (luciferase family)